MIDTKFSFEAIRVQRYPTEITFKINHVPPSRLVTVQLILEATIILDLELIQGDGFSLDQFINCLEDTLATLKIHQ